MIKPPFTLESATKKVQIAQDMWNTKNPQKIVQGYSINSQWRNRTAFIKGRESIIQFLKRKWEKELDYLLEKQLWSFTDNRISVRFEYEWRDADSGQWYRTHGNEHWEFDDDGRMKIRDMSGNDIPILESERRISDK
jgi:nuclear transport factor 2 (NTF2) superfamily protein